jgi:hypothetical protein
VISVVLPVHGQADHVGPVVEGHEAALGRLPEPHETLLVVNGRAQEATLAACREVASRFPAVRVLERAEPGWGGAVLLGLAEARGDLLCYANSARTTPEELVLMLLYARAFPDVVVKANRKIRESWLRRLGSLLFNLECRALFDLSTWDVNGTPKVFPRSRAALLALRRQDDLIDAEFAAACRSEGYGVIEVPIFSTRRHGGRSTTNTASAFRLYWGAYRLWKEGR